MSTLSLATILAESARRFPHKTALVDGATRIDYASLWREARQFARRLQDSGLQPGDRVALLCPNSIEFVRAYYGILAAGGVVVSVPTLLREAEIGYLVTDSGARFFVAHETLRDVADAVTRDLPGVQLLGPEADGEPIPTYVACGPEDTAVLFYTSGTTGRPKGALLSHLNLVMTATVNAFDANPFRHDEVVLGCLPLFHTFGQTVSLNSTFRVGATLVLQARFDAGEAIELMCRERVSAFFGVPTMFTRLTAAAAAAPALPALDMCISGGASLPVAALEAFEKAFSTTIFEGYGLSETSPTAAANQISFGTKPGTVGHPIWGVEVEIADAEQDGRITLLPRGTRGEVVIRGHNIFSGYHGRPDATAEALVDGWFRTGDIGILDDEGFLSIVDRKKDLIIRNGYNVYPRELEEILIRHVEVGEVAVIGLPDDEVGEEICAVVVPAKGTSPDPAPLLDWARERLGSHKYPRRFEIVDELPLGPSHKVLKRVLRDRFAPVSS